MNTTTYLITALSWVAAITLSAQESGAAPGPDLETQLGELLALKERYDDGLHLVATKRQAEDGATLLDRQAEATDGLELKAKASEAQDAILLLATRDSIVEHLQKQQDDDANALVEWLIEHYHPDVDYRVWHYSPLYFKYPDYFVERHGQYYLDFTNPTPERIAIIKEIITVVNLSQERR